MTRLQRILYSNSPLPYLKRRSKTIYLPGFQGLCLHDVLRFFANQIQWQSLTERAAAISYNIIMALPPSLLFLFTIIPSLPFIPKKSIKIQLHEFIIDVIPSKVHNDDIINFVDQFIDNTRVDLISFGLLFSLFFASNAMMGFIRSFNRDYPGFERRKGLAKRGVAIKLTILIFGLFFTYLVLIITQGRVLDLIVQNRFWNNFIYYSRWVLIVLLVFMVIALIFRYAPSVQKRWRFISPGAVLATILSLVASVGFSLFVNNFGRYNALYGAIGTIMVLTALIFINAIALLIGFELNVSINSLRSIRDKRDRKIPAIN